MIIITGSVNALFYCCLLFSWLPQCNSFITVSCDGWRNCEKRKFSASFGSVSSVQEQRIDLASGTRMQIMTLLPEDYQRNKPPLLFLHGSFHGAWCWTEKFFPYFASKGHPVIALSWRGTDGTYAGDGVKKVKIMEHVDDWRCVVDRFPEIAGLDSNWKPPVVIAHSFGGLAVMKALEEDPTMTSKLSGIVMMCSVPPSGNGKMTMRYLRRSLMDSYKITIGFAMKRCLKNEDLCRQLFFGGSKKVLPDGSIDDYGVSDDDIKRFQQYFARDSKATIDILDLSKKLPSLQAIDGRAPFVNELPPCMVLGATGDFIVDKEGVDETATYFGVDRPVIVDSPHDVMLGGKWENAAKELSCWLQTNF